VLGLKEKLDLSHKKVSFHPELEQDKLIYFSPVPSIYDQTSMRAPSREVANIPRDDSTTSGQSSTCI